MIIIEQSSWASAPGQWRGIVEAGAHGAPITIIFHSSVGPGRGPRLHKHPYAETFIMRTGQALFVIGDESVEAVAGQILIVPAGVPHKFASVGPDALETINIHASGKSITEWLE